MKKWILLSTFVLFVLALLAYLFFPLHPRKQDTLTLFGNVDIRQVDLGFRVLGKVQNLFVDEGDLVHPGMLLATLDPTPYQERVDEASAEVDRTKAALDNARILYERRKALLPTQSISQEDYDDALSNKNVSEANYEAALALLASAKTNLDDTQIYSPTDGSVLTRVREPGSIANVGDAVLTVSIASPVWVRAYVNEPNLGLIYPGMRGEVHTDTPGGKIYRGHIGFISPVAEFTPKTVETKELRTDLVYRLRLIVDDPDRNLRQGMPVTVKLFLQNPDE